MSLPESEYTVLRHTIASRGTARMVLVPVTITSWSLLAGMLTVFGQNPSASLFSLAILAGGFEAIHALHVGVERIGRYIQVFYEDATEGPRWETTAMSLGPALPGGGVDPLFSLLFLLAVMLNLVPALAWDPTRFELAVVLVLHAAALGRVARARWASTRQRAIDLESYRAIQTRLSGRLNS